MMDPEVLAAWLIENNLYGGQVSAVELSEALVEEFVLRRRNPPLEVPYQRKWGNPTLPTFRQIEIVD